MKMKHLMTAVKMVIYKLDKKKRNKNAWLFVDNEKKTSSRLNIIHVSHSSFTLKWDARHQVKYEAWQIAMKKKISNNNNLHYKGRASMSFFWFLVFVVNNC